MNMLFREKIARAIRNWLAFRKFRAKYKKTPEETEKLISWNAQMEREFQWDSKFQDFSFSDEWDKDFRMAMEEGFRIKEKKEKRKKVLLSAMACGAFALLIVVIILQCC